MNSKKNPLSRWHHLEAAWRSLVEADTVSLSGLALRACLQFLSFGYRGAVGLQRAAYTIGIRKRRVLPLPVISVGNLTLGGSGKTPVVQLLAEEIGKRVRIAIASRGYGGRAALDTRPTLVSQGSGPLVSPAISGDEPFLLAENVPGLVVLSGKSRFLSGLLAKHLGSELLILDDGFQHRSLKRDLEIVVVDEATFARGAHLFPRGCLRESRAALARADLIVSRGGCKEEIARYTSAPIVEMTLTPTKIVGERSFCLEELQGKKVGLFCGIGRPERFFSTVEELGAEVVARLPLGDHRAASPKHLLAFAQETRSKGGELLLCTQKDWVKLDRDPQLALPVSALLAKMRIIDGEVVWQEILSQTQQLVRFSSQC